MSKSIGHYINKIVALKQKEEKDDAVKRYALFPILDEKAFEFCRKQENAHWVDTECEFVADRIWYDRATPQVKRVIDLIMAFFLSGDGAISDNLIYRFLLECRTYEEKAMFIRQLDIELTHAITYGMAAFTFKRDPKAMAELIESVDNTPCVQAKIEFMEKWMLADRPRYQRLVAFCCAEGIFFCTLFAVIFWFRSKGQFPNLIFANELIAKDESLHRDFGAYLFEQEISLMLNEYERGTPEYQRVYEEIQSSTMEIIESALEIEKMFAEEMLKEPLEDLDAASLIQYARLISDNLLIQLSFPPIYHEKNPFTWLEDISMEQKASFYEVRVGAYKKKSLADILNWRKHCGMEEEQDKEEQNVFTNPEDIDF